MRLFEFEMRALVMTYNGGVVGNIIARIDLEEREPMYCVSIDTNGGYVQVTQSQLRKVIYDS